VTRKQHHPPDPFRLFAVMRKQKIKTQADRKKRFAHCSQLHHLHPPFDQQSQGTATQNISSSWGMTAHGSWQWSLCLQYTSALTSHKPLMSASHTLRDWELACDITPSTTTPGTNRCRIRYNCKAKCHPKGLPHCLDGSADASCDMKRELRFSLWCCLTSWDRLVKVWTTKRL